MTVPDAVAVIGGGRMGAGIAQVFAQAGATVVVIERDEDVAEAANERVIAGVGRAAARDASLDADAVAARVTVSTDYDAIASAQLVVEAVPEIHSLKLETLRRAESAISSNAWLTTNTSSLSVTELSEALSSPERLCGLHFFNPVPPSALVEVVVTPHTADQLAVSAKEWVTALGKTPIIVNDAPGFASSRLGVTLALEAMRMVEEGIANAEDVDAAMVLGYRHATGPLRTTDLVGLDVRLNISEYLASTLGERFTPPQILRDKVARGELGRKSGRGFFDYS